MLQYGCLSLTRFHRRDYPDLYIPVILQAACVLAFLAHPSHVLMYAPGDSLRRRLPATRII
ncbi:hypothetical protein C3428_11130 [Citrobacter braakii]|nr:hypothetical protein C3428_11130 [Citrobacter braakii]